MKVEQDKKKESEHIRTQETETKKYLMYITHRMEIKRKESTQDFLNSVDTGHIT